MKIESVYGVNGLPVHTDIFIPAVGDTENKGRAIMKVKASIGSIKTVPKAEVGVICTVQFVFLVNSTTQKELMELLKMQDLDLLITVEKRQPDLPIGLDKG